MYYCTVSIGYVWQVIRKQHICIIRCFFFVQMMTLC
jgi:hypothetical protein